MTLSRIVVAMASLPLSFVESGQEEETNGVRPPPGSPFSGRIISFEKVASSITLPVVLTGATLLTMTLGLCCCRNSAPVEKRHVSPHVSPPNSPRQNRDSRNRAKSLDEVITGPVSRYDSRTWEGRVNSELLMLKTLFVPPQGKKISLQFVNEFVEGLTYQVGFEYDEYGKPYYRISETVMEDGCFVNKSYTNNQDGIEHFARFQAAYMLAQQRRAQRSQQEP